MRILLIMSYDEKNIGLGHVRLAIIDIDEKANQPFLSRDNRYILVYNGEIYNYLELKSELESDGFEFTTNSDTEVLINAFKKWGTRCFRKFRGMFAGCILDKKTGKLCLFRDPFGIKPLYYSLKDGNLMGRPLTQ